MSARELNAERLLEALGGGQQLEGDYECRQELADAIDLASDQGQHTWLTDGDGKRIAAIVPADVAEREEQLS